MRTGSSTTVPTPRRPRLSRSRRPGAPRRHATGRPVDARTAAIGTSTLRLQAFGPLTDNQPFRTSGCRAGDGALGMFHALGECFTGRSCDAGQRSPHERDKRAGSMRTAGAAGIMTPTPQPDRTVRSGRPSRSLRQGNRGRCRCRGRRPRGCGRRGQKHSRVKRWTHGWMRVARWPFASMAWLHLGNRRSVALSHPAVVAVVIPKAEAPGDLIFVSDRLAGTPPSCCPWSKPQSASNA